MAKIYKRIPWNKGKTGLQVAWNKKPDIPKRELGILYNEERLTLCKIAKIYGISAHVIQRQMNEVKIPRRNNSECHNGHIPWNKKLNLSRGELERLYFDKNLPATRIADIYNVIVSTVYLQMRRYNIPCRNRSECHMGQIAWNKGIPCSKKTKEKIGLANSGRKLSEENKKIAIKNLVSMRGKKHTKETKKKISESRNRGIDEGRIVPWNKGKPRSKKVKKKLSILSKKLWENPEYIKSVMMGVQVKPNNDEVIVDSLIHEAKPNEFGYNGNLSLSIVIGGRIPDWVNVNGKKQVIEYFGEYWHSPLMNPKIRWNRTYEATIKHYKKYGFDCLVIWSNDLKNKEKVVKKIKEFITSV